MSPRGITRLPIRFASQIHSNLHKLLQSRKIAACPWGESRAAAAAWPCSQHSTAWHDTRSQWAAPGFAGRWHSQDDAKAGMPVPGYGGVAGGIWVVLGAWGGGVSLAMAMVRVHWWGCHQSKLSIPWGCRAMALSTSNQAHSAATQPNSTQNTPAQPPGRGHNTEQSHDGIWGRQANTET